MKLLGCHIDNFGAFRNFDLTFNDGLNVIMQANGWGKTTLSAFVKAMLYGFEGKRVRNVAENERLRYRPWQGGKYGGSLDFEARGREYRVIRTFGATAAKDDCKVVDIETGNRPRARRAKTAENGCSAWTQTLSRRASSWSRTGSVSTGRLQGCATG